MSSLRAVVVFGVAAASFGCTPEWARQNETGLFMEIADIQATAGTGGTGGEFLLSDVSPDFNDNAVVTVQAFRKNPTVTGSTPLEDIRLESYQVRYIRTDGRNVEGVDVPHRTTGPINTTILHAPDLGAEPTVTAGIILVRQQAKHEAPLVNLIGVFPSNTGPLVPGQGIITTFAEITIYGKQITSGEPLTATGRIQVTFADFGSGATQ
jgi:hypothetical protein